MSVHRVSNRRGLLSFLLFAVGYGSAPVGLASCRRGTENPTPPTGAVPAQRRPQSPPNGQSTAGWRSLQFNPAFLRVDVPIGEERTIDVQLSGPRAELPREALVVQVRGEEPPDVAVVDPSQACHAAGGVCRRVLRVRVRGRSTGSYVGRITMRTVTAVPEMFVLPYVVRVTGTLAVWPSNLLFALDAPGPQVQHLTVHSTRRGFVIHSATVVEGPFAAVLEKPAGDDVWRIAVRLRASRTNGGEPHAGRLIVRSNDPAEPIKDVPLLALGRVPAASANAPEVD